MSNFFTFFFVFFVIKKSPPRITAPPISWIMLSRSPKIKKAPTAVIIGENSRYEVASAVFMYLNAIYNSKIVPATISP